MLESTAFQCGVIFSLASILFNYIGWILAVLVTIILAKVLPSY